MEFKDKIVLITGAGSGIGKETALLFSKEGATIIIADINVAGGEATKKEIESSGGKASFVKTNVADYASVENMMEHAITEHGRIDVAVNNAGIGGKFARTAETENKDWDLVMAINSTGVFYCMKLQLQQMVKQGHGNIINISSIAGLQGLPNSIPYVASKHAVVGMTKTAAMEYARNNIRINAVCPVFTVTPLFQPDAYEKQSPGLSKKLLAGVPMRRFGKPSEIATAIFWLSSDKASFVTGHAMPVDGGLTA